MRIPLSSGDKIVSAVYYEGHVLVITEYGNLYRVTSDGFHYKVEAL